MSTEINEYISISNILADRVVLLTGTIFRDTGESVPNLLRLVTKEIKDVKSFINQRKYNDFVKPDDQLYTSVSERQKNVHNIRLLTQADRGRIHNSKHLVSLPDNVGMDNWPLKHEYLVYLDMTSEQEELYRDCGQEVLDDFGFRVEAVLIIRKPREYSGILLWRIQTLSLVSISHRSCNCSGMSFVNASTLKRNLWFRHIQKKCSCISRI